MGSKVSFPAGLAYSGSSGKDFFAEKYRMINEDSTYGLKTMSDIKEIRLRKMTNTGGFSELSKSCKKGTTSPF